MYSQPLTPSSIHVFVCGEWDPNIVLRICIMYGGFLPLAENAAPNDLFGPPPSLLGLQRRMPMHGGVGVKFRRPRLQSLTCIPTLLSRIKQNTAQRQCNYNVDKNNKYILINVSYMNHTVFPMLMQNSCGWMHQHSKMPRLCAYNKRMQITVVNEGGGASVY